jgi:hypothetical protein
MEEKKHVTEFTVERSRWHRGKGPQGSSLLRSVDGKMCCLGFLGIACGHSPEELEGVSVPSYLESQSRELRTANHFPESLWTMVLYGELLECEITSANDETCEFDRESRLKNLFARIGIEVKFVD